MENVKAVYGKIIRLTGLIQDSDATQEQKDQMDETLGGISFLAGCAMGTADRYRNLLLKNNIKTDD